MTTTRDKIAAGKLKASTKLAAKGLGGRDRTLYYRSRVGTGGKPEEGIPATKTAWASALSISPNPIIEDIKAYLTIDGTIIKTGSIKVSINTPNYTKANLESYEFALLEGSSYVAYSLVEGSGVMQDKNKYYWILYLRKV